MSTPGTAPLPVLAEGLLAVGDGHEIFWEESGNRDGVPVLYLHGGPGGRLSPGYRRSAPAERARIIGLSQRGAGRSTPSAGTPGAVDLGANTTAHLVADLELLREHLGISAWIIEGVSWGSTLALAYSQAHPERVLGVVLFAVTSTSRREVDWITEGIGAVFPEGWDALATFAERHGSYRRGTGQRLVEAYRQLLSSTDADADPRLVDDAAEAWMTWEDEHIRIGTGAVGISRPQAPAGEQERIERRAFARLVTHYWAHDGFVADWAVRWGAAPGSGLLGGMSRLAGIPGVLIHGRRDVSGPALTAWELHRAWPGSELVMIEDEGHGGPRMVEEWRAAMARLVAQNA
ncbi:alpha/beta fold hydrolase [Brachybacterium tyrofermentans]|uniref:alpha/beta fold hydrolase n=1 Tax=Brachybacterium tyrofermentans TaxID=47848 RepID=UPI003FB6A736